MSFSCAHQERLNIVDQDLVHPDILFDRPNFFRQALILLQDDSSLWTLSSVEDFGNRSIGHRYLIGIREIFNQQIEFLFQPVKGLKDRDPELVDGKEFAEGHPFDGLSFLDDILREEIALS